MEIAVKIMAGEKMHELKCMDSVFDYMRFRRLISEKDCLTLIEKLKKGSNKKIAVVFGNCQSNGIIDFLSNHPVFCEEYFFIKLPAAFEYNNNNVQILDEGFWKLCDLFISQRIHKNNRFHPNIATQRFTQYLPEDAKIIWIPNIYFEGYFPQYLRNLYHNVDTDKHEGGRFPYADKYIDDYILYHQYNGGGGRIRQINGLHKKTRIYYTG